MWEHCQAFTLKTPLLIFHLTKTLKQHKWNSIHLLRHLFFFPISKIHIFRPLTFKMVLRKNFCKDLSFYPYKCPKTTQNFFFFFLHFRKMRGIILHQTVKLSLPSDKKLVRQVLLSPAPSELFLAHLINPLLWLKKCWENAKIHSRCERTDPCIWTQQFKKKWFHKTSCELHAAQAVLSHAPFWIIFFLLKKFIIQQSSPKTCSYKVFWSSFSEVIWPGRFHQTKHNRKRQNSGNMRWNITKIIMHMKVFTW